MTIINGVNLHYEVIGVGEPLLLVHGSWGDHREYEQVAPALAARFRVLSYDRRGHSASGPAAGSVSDDIADAAALIEHLDLGPTDVFGACNVVPLWLAARRPDLVRSACLHEPALFSLLPEGAPEPPGEALALDLIESGRHEEAARTFFEQVVMGQGAWDHLAPPIRHMLVGHASAFAEERGDPDASSVDTGALARSGVPVRITHGADGDPIFRAVATCVAEAVPNAAVEEVPGRHVPHISHPSPFVATLTNWLRASPAVARTA